MPRLFMGFGNFQGYCNPLSLATLIRMYMVACISEIHSGFLLKEGKEFDGFNC